MLTDVKQHIQYFSQWVFALWQSF